MRSMCVLCQGGGKEKKGKHNTRTAATRGVINCQPYSRTFYSVLSWALPHNIDSEDSERQSWGLQLSSYRRVTSQH